MFKSKTVFVIGAGASCEVGLPSGADLKSQIAKNIDIRFEDGWTQSSGNYKITEALREHVRRLDIQPPDINPYLKAAWVIRDAAPQAISINNFMEAHLEDEKIQLCGKLGIVQSILEAERASKLYVNFPHSTAFLHAPLGDTWYSSFVQLLTENVPKTKIETLFENVSFVIFNYDRCIEHFLVHAVRNYYSISEDSARQLVSSVSMFHPYGLVGRLPWQDQKGILFGADIGGVKLLDISAQIKTFGERVEEEITLAAIRHEVQEAKTLIFLGFAFHPLNMELIKPEAPSSATRVFWTSHGISHSDWAPIQKDILATIQRKSQHVAIESRLEITCSRLFKEYWRSLSRS